MFRAIVKQRSNLDLLPIADMQILNASISEDTTQKATSTINVVEVPSNVFLGDLVGVYTSKGVFIYWGTISAINENKITLQQFNSFYNDTHLLVPQTSNNQKTFFNTKTISNVIELYLKSKELGHQSTLNDMSASLVPAYQGLVDKDVANNYKGITHTIIDNEQTFAPYPQEKESKNLETFLYDMFNTYNRIIRPNLTKEKSSIYLAKTLTSINTQPLLTYYAVAYGLDNNYEITNVSLEWEKVADENGTYTSVGNEICRYGTTNNDRWNYKWINGTTTFSNVVWGDSASGYGKIGQRLKSATLTISPETSIEYEVRIVPTQPTPRQELVNLFLFYPNGLIEYDTDKYWDYNEKKLFDTWEMLSNVQIVKQDEDTNVVAIYNQDGTTLRGAYTILNDGTIQQITDGVAIPNRVGSNKTKYVFDSNNNVLDLAKANLPNLQYNHKITFNINFDGEYKFEDFNLAQPIKFYSTKDNTLFNSILTGRKYEISQNSDVIQNATFTLGKVRNTLTDKVMKIRNNR